MTSPDHPLPGLLPPKILDWGQWLCFDTYLLKIKDRKLGEELKHAHRIRGLKINYAEAKKANKC